MEKTAKKTKENIKSMKVIGKKSIDTIEKRREILREIMKFILEQEDDWNNGVMYFVQEINETINAGLEKEHRVSLVDWNQVKKNLEDAVRERTHGF